MVAGAGFEPVAVRTHYALLKKFSLQPPLGARGNYTRTVRSTRRTASKVATRHHDSLLRPALIRRPIDRLSVSAPIRDTG